MQGEITIVPVRDRVLIAVARVRAGGKAAADAA